MKNCLRQKVFLSPIFHLNLKLMEIKIFCMALFKRIEVCLQESYICIFFAPPWIVSFLKVAIYLSLSNAKYNRLYRKQLLYRESVLSKNYILPYFKIVRILSELSGEHLIIKAIKMVMKPHFLLKSLTFRGKTVACLIKS